MARVTKFRSRQTRAADTYSADDENLATDGEVEQKVRKHSTLFHGVRDNNTHFIFDADGNLSQIITQDPANAELYKQTDFVFDANGNLSQIVKEIKDVDGSSYTKLQKDLLFDINGNLNEIQNRII